MSQKIGKLSVIGCSLINIFLFPGLGTFLYGRIKTGILQMLFFTIGFLLIFTTFGKFAVFNLLKNIISHNPEFSYIATAIVYFGIPTIVFSWIWSLISTIKMIKIEFFKQKNR
jgi:TM2 domain-containing membrane protein YozV